MKVAIINTTTGNVLHVGDTDGKRIGGLYIRVDGELYNVAYAFHEAQTTYVSTRIKSQARDRAELEKAQIIELQDLRRDYGVHEDV